MNCPNCGEDLEGDGFYFVIKCPNVKDEDAELAEYAAPDEGPFYCKLGHTTDEQ